MDADDALLRREGHLFARWNQILVWVSHGALDDELLRELRKQLESIADEFPSGAALLLIGRGHSELPKLETRRKIARGLASLGERLQCVAAAFEGSRPWLEAGRTLIERLIELIPRAFPMRVFGDRDEAIIWLGEAVLGPDGRPIDTAELGPFVESLLAASE
ncbi:hypothetical protein G6O69_21800 [Pseudenhygromyxa sp. WMMC2535]|uniref:hypothetical protein n=1 Tax=Pseudenhygromyxa sp. WMMC2535 TaxID=2712867 RepID=UPI001554FC31|nr:hypothetical protein [Pseudenhygromyxa sp. WMMC2535]NVB40490.1 hypothetical protein [Pseudenhygromyxa sp. WMMC2535]